MRSQSIVIAGMIILTLALATAAMAADPLIGTWKLNVTKSTISQTQPFNVTFREIEGDKIEVTTTSINADGSAISAISVRATWPRMGGPVQILQGGNEALSYFVILVEPGNWYQAIVRDGRQVALRHITFSKDGKVMTQTIKGGVEGCSSKALRRRTRIRQAIDLLCSASEQKAANWRLR